MIKNDNVHNVHKLYIKLYNNCGCKKKLTRDLEATTFPPQHWDIFSMFQVL